MAAGAGEGGSSGRVGGNGRSTKPPFWLVASSLRESQTTESIHSGVRNALLLPRAPLCDDVGLFDVPMSLKFGSFDDLIRAVDTLQKQDGVVEAVLRRVERQALEIDPEAQFKIMWQRHSLTAEQYIRRFTWDESKFPKARAIRENIEAIVQSVNKMDEEVRAKVAVWQEVRQQANAAASKRDVLSYSQRDLLDLLTPAVVEEEDFVQTEHLTTAVVCVAGEAEANWLSTYEKLNPFVVPRSAKKFGIPPDKEGVCLWRVVLFKKGLNDFKKAAAEHKFTVRDFNYSEGVYKEMTEQRAKVLAEQTKHETFLSRVCFAAFSDIFVAWVHLKAMRVFCESVLRFGVPPNFVSFFLRPISENKEKKIHKELDALVTPPGLFGNRFYARDSADGAEGENFFPYVLLTLQPFAS
ncbi:vacuolar ATP synthase subunit c, putative [Eimeria acervulina]|uniref:V-type proton ATPase subunit C n=1 Tax=Eimeria acervulina TaxID=5801 RepID=U6GDB8_EIMAC|nr:vacuolar ATP synthase subunit c, putative [Eimeria acervulina]CDI77348.1 vacuolar ATP synthase subunit c, putative [Eimeria acervulina]